MTWKGGISVMWRGGTSDVEMGGGGGGTSVTWRGGDLSDVEGGPQ